MLCPRSKKIRKERPPCSPILFLLSFSLKTNHEAGILKRTEKTIEKCDIDTDSFFPVIWVQFGQKGEGTPLKSRDKQNKTDRRKDRRLRLQKRGLDNPANEHDACGVGCIAHIEGIKSHDLILKALGILDKLAHRGAIGGDMKTGDGVGILSQIPDAFFRKKLPFSLPEAGQYGVGFFFLPQDSSLRETIRETIESVTRDCGIQLLGWREVPVNPEGLGEMAVACMPAMHQVFFAVPAEPKASSSETSPPFLAGDPAENKFYQFRKILENTARKKGWDRDQFYIPSLSSRTIVYKGMFVADQFIRFYPDLRSKHFTSALAVVHQRYSTNTFPSWPLAHPFRYIAHNGEINTIRRNMNNMLARESSMQSGVFKNGLKDLYPVIPEGSSDSSSFDNVFELLVQNGRSMPHAMMMMIPEAFSPEYHMSRDRRAFYEYQSSIMEPWDGPAAVVFTDGRSLGATLDRNGLRPGRYTVTKEGFFVLGSETGVVDIAPSSVRERGRLYPGKLILVETEKKRILKDNAVKNYIVRRRPYRRWLNENRITLKGLFNHPAPVSYDEKSLRTSLRYFHYTYEQLKLIIKPMALNGQEPIGSMGNDAPPAVLDSGDNLLYDYFRQLFAQVTNPPIDPYREKLVMSLFSFVGRERNLLDESPEHCRQLELAHPILTNEDIQRLKETEIPGFEVAVLSLLFPVPSPEESEKKNRKSLLREAMKKLYREAEEAIRSGASLLILSDRGVSETEAALPALLAVSGLHHYLVKKQKRHLSGIIIESGEVREVHQFACLIAYGASGVNPYLTFELIAREKDKGHLSEASLSGLLENYINAVKKGLLKIMSKMGISTIRSYRGGQLFEAVGLKKSFIKEYFTKTESLIEGIGLPEIEQELLKRHQSVFYFPDHPDLPLPEGSSYYERDGGSHLFSARSVITMQKAIREDNYRLFKEYSREVNESPAQTFRSLFRLKKGKERPIPPEQVESEYEIVKRFVSAAMSFGSISPQTHQTIAVTMNGLGARSNSGEGGEDERRFDPLPDGRSSCSRIKQVASGRFGVNSSYLAHADELQIKMAQGAKPGEGGQLPGHKVDQTIARIRNSTPGVMLISPPPHHDIYSIEDLSQLIFDLKNANPKARVAVKLVASHGVGTIAAGVAKGEADTVIISGSDGGTGASPLSSIRYAGSFWEIGLAETQQVLIRNKLRSKIRIQVDGQIKTGRDVVIGALLGAEEFGLGTTVLVALGCLMMRKCHTNTCPVGIATQNEELKKKFPGKEEHLRNFLLFLAREVREIMAELGFARFDDMVGRVDRLEALPQARRKGLNFDDLLIPPRTPGESLYCTEERKLDRSLSLDPSLIREAREALENKKPVSLVRDIYNHNRSVGTTLSYEVSRRYRSEGLPDDTVKVTFTGSAGQSFGAFLAQGITFTLKGEANDYLGKGLSGGRIILRPEDNTHFIPHKNIITGNVNFFGATGGEAYINGIAGERFAVRNSGARLVVEGIGDHGCEYMTGGRVVILGETGLNFAAGMSGGISYVYDVNQLFDTRCNLEMVEIEPVVSSEDREFLYRMIESHYFFTRSVRAKEILDYWEENISLFVRVIPMDYKKALQKIKEQEEQESETMTITEEVYH